MPEMSLWGRPRELKIPSIIESGGVCPCSKSEKNYAVEPRKRKQAIAKAKKSMKKCTRGR